MKKIGLVGGISWASTLDYYRLLNEEVNRRLGGLHFAECIIYSIDFHRFHACNAEGNWKGMSDLLTEAALHLERAGADVVLLCSNTAHTVAEVISEKLQVPLIDIRSATLNAVRSQGLEQVGLLGSVYTMEMGFYRDLFTEACIQTLIPQKKEDRDYIEQTLLYELGKGIVLDNTRQAYVRLIHQLIERGAEGVILGCTEIPLLIRQEDVQVPVFNTTQIHVQAAVDFALS